MALGQHAAGHAQFVPIPPPAIDMNRADLGSHALGLHDGHDAIHGAAGQGGHVLTKIDGQVIPTGKLIGRHAAAWHLCQHPLAHSGQTKAQSRQIRVAAPMAATQALI
jgi:hypothetical protein